MEKETMLVRQAKKGNAEAFSQLYEGVYKDLYRFALYTLKCTHDAEDVVSDTVTDAWAQIAGLKNEESFRAWIFRILSNKCRQRLKAYINKTIEIPEDLCAPARDTEEDADVRAAFSRLEHEERLLLSLKLFGGYKSVEIANILGMNENTVRSKQKRALEKMAEYLSK